ncbi:unnamed protein product [Paramecium sonneborni]|uniref:Uncharacterized protein n=1 Tax=Paramecium sonneborni TaxID=65129 RepID=A0A8S1L2P1_9CILI|nr:unnamed protein product [Paramecium sonneborni]
MLNQSKYSPINSSRYQKSIDNLGFSNSQVTTQMNKRQLTEFRKEVRNNILNREPFKEHQDKPNIYFGNWGQTDRTILNNSQYFSEPLSQKRQPTSKISGGLNFNEIFSNKRFENQSKAISSNKIKQVEKAPLIQNKFDSFFDNSFTKPSRINNTLGSGYKESPQKSQIRLERFKSWDTKLDVQLKLQNKSITNKIGEQPSIYKQLNEVKQGGFTSIYTPTLSVKNRNNVRDYNQFQDICNLTPKQNLLQSPQFTNKKIEKIPLTDVVRMTSHFSSLSTQEIKKVSSGYFQELINLQQSLQRMIRLGTNIY